MVRQYVAESGETSEAFLASLGSTNLLKRMPLVKEVGEVAAFMASDRASALTNIFVSVACEIFYVPCRKGNPSPVLGADTN